MNIDKIPESTGNKPKIISFAVDEDTFNKLQYLRDSKNKQTSALLRLLLKEFFEENKAHFDRSIPRGR